MTQHLPLASQFLNMSPLFPHWILMMHILSDIVTPDDDDRQTEEHCRGTSQQSLDRKDKYKATEQKSPRGLRARPAEMKLGTLDKRTKTQSNK